MEKTLLTGMVCLVLIAAMATGASASPANLDCTGKNKDNNATYRTGFEEIDTLHITARSGDGSGSSSNVDIILCGHDELLLEYNKSVHKFSVDKEAGTATVQLWSQQGVDYEFDHRMVLHIPDKAYKKVTVDNNQAGVSLTAMDADTVVTCEKGALSVTIPQGFQKTLDMTCDKSAASINFHKAQANFTLALQADGSAVSLPDSFPKDRYYRYDDYRHSVGGGKAKITVKASASAFSITDDAKNQKEVTVKASA